MTVYYSYMPTKKSKKKKNGFGFTLWALGLVIILIIFLVKKDDIVTNLKTTRAFERLGLQTPEFVEKHEIKAPKNDEKPVAGETVITLHTQDKARTAQKQAAPAPQSQASSAQTKETSQTPAQAAKPAQDALPAQEQPSTHEMKETQTEPQPTVTTQTQAAPQPQATTTQAASAAKTAAPAKPTPPAPAPVKTNAKLYFVTIENDGAVSRKQITRSIAKTDSPLSENIKQLLAGPNQAERAKGCISLIPENTRLLSASVSNGIAQLNFNEAFEFNRVGVEGYLGQLMQIVYTATEFSTVSSVQILIEGQKKEYLGSEGVWIGSPLSRSSF